MKITKLGLLAALTGGLMLPLAVDAAQRPLRQRRDRIEDVRDRREDLRDRREDVRDRREDILDRREDRRDRQR